MNTTLWTCALIVVLPSMLATRTTGQSPARPASAASKPRVVITQDPELDDVNTIIRALLYSTDFKIEGLVYSSANFHFKGDGKGTTQYIAGREYARMGLGPVTSWRWPTKDKEKWMDEIVDAYEKVYANLRGSPSRLPDAGELRSRINGATSSSTAITRRTLRAPT